ncbi:pyridoxal phosphate-dependent aminotransferase [Atopobacter phocae]|uniref:pyridoxal phosphate-dependent aminotransferase n=1 Tax=Atopobacter phocae TaxID=136492 RepID=UPI000470E725|nr:aminotransferase class I/II-fold pyridoxal phosphate-dependent enzyme [Atopobacter phocae]
MHQVNQLTKQVKELELLKYTIDFRQIDDLIMLTVGEPDFPAPDLVKKAAIEAIEMNMTGYAPGKGILPLRQEIVNYIKRKYHVEYHVDQITAVMGLTEGIGSILMALLNPGDEVIIPTPFFSPYESATIMNNGRPVFVDTSATDFKLTPELLKATLVAHPKARILMLNYPSNPTGVSYTREEIKALAEMIKTTELLVVSDEIYAELLYEGTHTTIAEFLPEQTFLMNGVSKSHAMTGWRVGFIAAPTAYLDAVQKAHEVTAAIGSTQNQLAAVTAFRDCDDDVARMRESYRERRDYLLRELADLGFNIKYPMGAFYLFPQLPDYVDIDDREFAMRLAHEAKVGVLPGSVFGPGGEGYLRISYATSLVDLKRSVERLKQFLTKQFQYQINK